MTHQLKTAFDGITASPELKSTTLEAIRSRKPRQSKVPFALAAACLLVCVFLGVGYRWVNTPVACISIDVNPSMELELNRFDRVISARGFNPEGETVLESTPVTGLPCEEAIAMLLSSRQLQDYLNPEAFLSITVAAESPEKQQSLTQVALRCTVDSPAETGCYESSLDCLEQAHCHGLSLGKYTAWQTLSQYEEDLTPEDCRHMTMAQLHRAIEAHEGCCESGSGSGEGHHNASSTPSSSRENGHHGQGHK